MSSIFVCDEFARLTPENDAAKRLFHDCYTYVKAEEPFHCNFMIGTGTQQSQLLEPLDSDTDYDTTASESETLALGCYSISFASSREPEFPRLGWRVGRGTRKNVNRNVDFLLCKPRDNHDSSKSLTSNHFRLELNSQSGFLVLRAGLNPNASLKYFASGQWEQLEAGSTKLLYMKTTLIQAGICAYALSYIINEKDRQDLLRLRRQYIEKFGSYRTEIFRQFSGLPGDQILETNHFVQYETKGAGSFGWVNQGLDKTTGNVVAIKELQIMPGRSPWEIVKSEVKIGKRFQNDEGLLPILDAFCEHGGQESCRPRERYYIVSPYAITDLYRYRSRFPDIAHENKLLLVQGILRGLKTLHENGIMHRDISLKNILLQSLNPPRAVICDFGKAIEATEHTDTGLGAVHSIAPEVWNKSPYSHKIDLWSLGYMLAQLFGYRCAHNEPITKYRQAEICRLLENQSRDAANTQLQQFNQTLLAWNPSERPTAAIALQHSCWHALNSAQAESQKEESQAKKVKAQAIYEEDATVILPQQPEQGIER